MKLDMDCVRAVLMTIEENCDFENFFEYETGDKYKLLKRYSHNEIAYHIKQCQMSGLIVGVRFVEDGDCIMVNDLSPKGHEFLANIRSNKIWGKTKSIAKTIGCTSLNAFVQISSNVIIELVKAQFGIPGIGLFPTK